MEPTTPRPESRTFFAGLLLVTLGVVSLSVAALILLWFFAAQDAPIAPPPVAVAGPVPVVSSSPPLRPDTPDEPQAGQKLVSEVAAGRSPMPREGEVIEKPLEARKLSEPSEGPPPSKDEVIPWHRAGQFLGQTITIQGVVVRTNAGGKVVHLNFDKDWKDKFYLILFEDAMKEVEAKRGEPADRYFLNKTIRITGAVRAFKGVPHIQVRDADRIQVLDAAQPVAK